MVELVGGSGPHEGNILVGGQPVCDDYHDDQNALVVCRFTKHMQFFLQVQFKHPNIVFENLVPILQLSWKKKYFANVTEE